MSEYPKAKIGDVFSFTRFTLTKVETSLCVILKEYKDERNGKAYLQVEWLDQHAKEWYDSFNYAPDHFQGNSWRKLS